MCPAYDVGHATRARLWAIGYRPSAYPSVLSFTHVAASSHTPAQVYT